MQIFPSISNFQFTWLWRDFHSTLNINLPANQWKCLKNRKIGFLMKFSSSFDVKCRNFQFGLSIVFEERTFNLINWNSNFNRTKKICLCELLSTYIIHCHSLRFHSTSARMINRSGNCDYPREKQFIRDQNASIINIHSDKFLMGKMFFIFICHHLIFMKWIRNFSYIVVSWDFRQLIKNFVFWNLVWHFSRYIWTFHL
jgi:hypothetical protein